MKRLSSWAETSLTCKDRSHMIAMTQIKTTPISSFESCALTKFRKSKRWLSKHCLRCSLVCIYFSPEVGKWRSRSTFRRFRKASGICMVCMCMNTATLVMAALKLATISTPLTCRMATAWMGSGNNTSPQPTLFHRRDIQLTF